MFRVDKNLSKYSLNCEPGFFMNILKNESMRIRLIKNVLFCMMLKLNSHENVKTFSIICCCLVC